MLDLKVTIPEANKLLRGLKEQKKKDFGKFKIITKIFWLSFIVMSCLRTLFVSTVIVALFDNKTDIIDCWNKGYGFWGLGIYLLASLFDFMRLLDIGIIIATIIGTFTIGNGFGTNFMTYALPILLCYLIVFGLCVGLNFLYNAIIQKACPKTYEDICDLMDEIEFRNKMFGGF